MIAVILVLVFVIALNLYSKNKFQYWSKKGIKHDKPVFLLGTNAEGFLLQKSISQCNVDAYNKYPNEKVVGLYRSWRPELVVRDPEIIKKVLISDFSYFYPRGLLRSTEVEPLMRNLFFAEGDLWRLLRQRMTPAFTSGKLKAMFPLIVERAERLQVRALKAASEGQTLDARDLMARYTTDFIGACGFGLDADSLSDENSAFRKLGSKIFKITVYEAIIGILKEVAPATFKDLKYLTRVEKEMVDLVKEILKQRNYKPSGRNDFIDLMLECQEKGTIVGESIERIKSDGNPDKASLEIDEALIAAQVFVFFAAGFETSSSATSFTLHQLAFNPDVQIKVQEEIDRVLLKHNNKLSYDAIQEMSYLECAFKEGLRMFPSLGYLVRRCARKYTIPDLGVTVDEGVRIFIPLQALHNDPQYFDEPEEFRPERFEDESHLKHKYVYLPFGDGPRACIGARMGMMQSLAGLAAVLSKFTVKPSPQTLRYPVIEPKSEIVQSVKYGLPLLFEKRENTVS